MFSTTTGRRLRHRRFELGEAADQPRHADGVGGPDGENGVRQFQAPQGGGVPARRHRVKAQFLVGFEAEAGVHDDDVGDLLGPFQNQRQARRRGVRSSGPPG